MAGDETNTPEQYDLETIYKSEVTGVRKFITQMWEHPLVDEQTRQHRIDGIIKFNEELKKQGIVEGVSACLVGSSLWAVEHEADWDFVVFDRNNAYDTALASPDLNTVAKLDHTNKPNQLQRDGSEFALLFVPDDYIAGDIDAARIWRKGLVNRMDLKDPQYSGKDYLQAYLKEFERHYKNWGDPFNWTESNPNKQEERHLRMIAKLKLRWEQSHMGPQKYLDEFINKLNAFRPPDIHDFSRAMDATGGKLTVDPKYSAESIRNSKDN